MDSTHAKRILEAAILCAPQPLSMRELRTLLQDTLEAEAIQQLLHDIRQEWEYKGVELVSVASGWRFQSKPEMHSHLDRLYPEKPPKYSRATLETLAIVAYRQPVTRAEVEQIRGVKCDYSLQSLMNKELIAEVGRKEALGRPILYGTTDNFLAHFGISSLKELPPMPEKPKDDSDDAEMTDDVPELIP